MSYFAKINGKMVELSGGGKVRGSDIINYASKGTAGRRVIMSDPTGVHNTRIDPDKYYEYSDFSKSSGKPVEIRTMPERVKGDAAICPAGTFFKPRSQTSLSVITDQVLQVAGYLFKGQDVAFDTEGGHTMVVPKYKLPNGWKPAATPLLIIFPVEYPELPPNGFYIQHYVTAPANHGHIYARAYNEGYGAKPGEQEELNRYGWVWYCAHVANGAWQPAKLRKLTDWHYGDNLFTFFALISEVMNTNA